MSDSAAMSDVGVASPAAAPAAAAAPVVDASSAMTDTTPAAAAASTGVKRKLEEDSASAAAPAAADAAANGEPAGKKAKSENGAASPTAAAPSSPAVVAAAKSPAAAPSSGAARAAGAGAAVPTKKLIPKKILPSAPGGGGASTIVGKPMPIAKPGTVAAGPKPIAKPAAAAAAGTTVAAGAAASSSSAAAAASAAPAKKPASKPTLKKSAAASDSSSSSSSSDSDSDSEESDDEPLVGNGKKKNVTTKAPPAAASSSVAAAAAAKSPQKKAPPRKAAPKKKAAVSSGDDSSSSSSSDSSDDDSSSGSDSSSSDSSDSDSDASAATPRKRAGKAAAAGSAKKKTPAKKKPAAKKAGSNTKYKGNKRPKAEGEESGSSSEEEGVDESKIILYPMDKYDLRAVVEPLKETQGANKWWNRLRAPGDKTKWTTLEHNGILFPAAYVPHNQPFKYDGVDLALTPEQEEVASMWALMPENFQQLPTFAKNFFRDFKALFPKDTKVKELAKCDFSIMARHLINERDTAKIIKKNDPKARARDKAEKDQLQETYGYALVDGFKEKVGNYRVEPPNLFRGRGDHPKTGTLKRRVRPEDIIINIGPNTPIPPPPPGHKWKGIIHNNKVTWLAFYRDNVNGDFKYIWLAPSSRFKGESDVKKYAKAQKLKKYIAEIRKNYHKEMKSEHSQFRQRATAIYLIDQLALRVGNEKDKSEVADTVGCCSLRVEHLKFDPPRTVTFDFLGKDSMRYLNTVELDERAYANLKSFTVGKKPKEEIFDGLSTSLLNEHLKSLMPELTAKVFRTYNASVTLEKELQKNDVSIDEHVSTKRNFYNAANREVAILCNHQRSIPKGHEAGILKLRDQMDSLNDDRAELEDWIEEMSEKKKSKAAEAAREERDEQRAMRRAARLGKLRSEAKAKKDKEKEDRAKLRAAGKTVPEEEEEEEDPDYGVKEKVKTKPTDIRRAEAQLEKVKERLVNYEGQLALKDQTKDVALGTSKINYMDPRITVAWCKAKEVPLEMVFNKSLVTKFPWAMEVPMDWQF